MLASSAATLSAQNNNEAATVTKQGIEASNAKDWDKAVTSFRRATELDKRYAPNLSAALQQRAMAYVGQQKFPEAEADLTEALKLKPDDEGTLARRAYVELQSKDYDKALKDYNALIKSDDKEIKYYSTRAYILQMKNDWKGALEDTEKVLQMDPTNADAQTRKRFLSAKLNPGPTPVVTPEGPIRRGQPRAGQPLPAASAPVPSPAG